MHGLELNEQKTRLVYIYREGIRFLGFSLSGRHSERGRAYPHVEPAAGSCAALRRRLREILNHGTEWRSAAEVVGEVNAVVRGWSGYFHYGNSVRAFGKTQHWVRNRLRRWLWRKHACTRLLHGHYTTKLLHETYGLLENADAGGLEASLNQRRCERNGIRKAVCGKTARTV